MLPTKMPLSACWPMRGLLDDLELAVLDHLHAGLVLRVARGRERELAERRVQVLHLGQAGVDVLAAALAPRQLDGLGEDVQPGVRLRRELIRVDALLCHRLQEALVGGALARAVPRGADQ